MAGRWYYEQGSTARRWVGRNHQRLALPLARRVPLDAAQGIRRRLRRQMDQSQADLIFRKNRHVIAGLKYLARKEDRKRPHRRIPKGFHAALYQRALFRMIKALLVSGEDAVRQLLPG